MTSRDETFAARFSERRAAAEAYLWREMNARGLHAQDGWKIMDLARETRDGSELVLRPMHLWQPAPQELVCVISLAGEDPAMHAAHEPTGS
jgi:hypothetical protein